MIRLKSLLLEQYRPEMENTRDTRFKSDGEIKAEKKAELEKAKRDLKRLEAKRKKLEQEKAEAKRLEKVRLEKEIQKNKELEAQKKKDKQNLEKEIETERENQRDIWSKEDELKKKKEDELKKKKEDELKKKKEDELKKKKEDELKKKKPGYPPDEDLPTAGLDDNWFGPISATGNGYELRGTDCYGGGHYHARRSGGTRKHAGLDIKSKAGDPVFSPMDCKIKRVYRIYQPGYKQDKCKYLIGVLLEGTGEYLGYVFRIFYVKLASGYKVGQQIKKGDAFAIMQDLENPCYPPCSNGSRMTNHIHWEYYKDKYVKKKDINPVPLIGMKKPN